MMAIGEAPLVLCEVGIATGRGRLVQKHQPPCDRRCGRGTIGLVSHGRCERPGSSNTQLLSKSWASDLIDWGGLAFRSPGNSGLTAPRAAGCCRRAVRGDACRGEPGGIFHAKMLHGIMALPAARAGWHPGGQMSCRTDLLGKRGWYGTRRDDCGSAGTRPRRLRCAPLLWPA